MKFQFRLQKVLEYRARLEEEAKNVYLDKRAERLEAEAKLGALDARRREALRHRVMGLDEHLLLERNLLAIEDQERAQHVVIQVLADEEESLRLAWIEKKQELEALEKLREKSLEEWKQEEARREQNALDEWATMRREAA